MSRDLEKEAIISIEFGRIENEKLRLKAKIAEKKEEIIHFSVYLIWGIFGLMATLLLFVRR